MIYNFEWYFRAIQKMKVIAYANIFKSFVFIIGITTIFVFNLQDSLYIGLAFFSSFLIFVTFMYVNSGLHSSIRFVQINTWIYPILKESLALGASLLVLQFYNNFGIIILEITWRTKTYKTITSIIFFETWNS